MIMELVSRMHGHDFLRMRLGASKCHSETLGMYSEKHEIPESRLNILRQAIMSIMPTRGSTAWMTTVMTVRVPQFANIHTSHLDLMHSRGSVFRGLDHSYRYFKYTGGLGIRG